MQACSPIPRPKLKAHAFCASIIPSSRRPLVASPRPESDWRVPFGVEGHKLISSQVDMGHLSPR